MEILSISRNGGIRSREGNTLCLVHVNALVGQSRRKEIFKTHIYRDWVKFKARQSLSEEESAHRFKD